MLIPCWVVQLFFEFWMVVAMALVLGVVESQDSDLNIEVNKTAVEIIAPIWLTVGLICMVLTIVEIILLSRHKLKPKTFVIMNTIKSTIWAGLFLYDLAAVIVYNKNGEGDSRVSGVGSLIVEAILLMSFWAPLIYGSVIYHRSRKAKGTYAQVGHPYDMPIDTSYNGEPYTAGPSELSSTRPAAAYETQYEPFREHVQRDGPSPGPEYEMGSRRELR